ANPGGCTNEHKRADKSAQSRPFQESGIRHSGFPPSLFTGNYSPPDTRTQGKCFPIWHRQTANRACESDHPKMVFYGIRLSPVK
ncbi:MAG: hypothetical protein ACI3V0_06295, partial [Faecousia sp.]